MEEYYQLPYWHDRVKSFKKMKAEPHTAKVFIGDSITEGYDLWQFYHDRLIFNMGIGGDYTSGILMRLEPLVRLQPKKIFLMIGINDIRQNIPIETIKENYAKIIDAIRQQCPQSTLYIQSNLPTNQSVSSELNADVIDTRVRALNAFLVDQCKLKGANFIELYPLFVVNENRLNPDLTYDGLHLKHEGYIIWTNHIRALVEQ